MFLFFGWTSILFTFAICAAVIYRGGIESFWAIGISRMRDGVRTWIHFAPPIFHSSKLCWNGNTRAGIGIPQRRPKLVKFWNHADAAAIIDRANGTPQCTSLSLFANAMGLLAASGLVFFFIVFVLVLDDKTAADKFGFETLTSMNPFLVSGSHGKLGELKWDVGLTTLILAWFNPSNWVSLSVFKLLTTDMRNVAAAMFFASTVIFIGRVLYEIIMTVSVIRGAKKNEALKAANDMRICDDAAAGYCDDPRGELECVDNVTYTLTPDWFNQRYLTNLNCYMSEEHGCEMFFMRGVLVGGVFQIRFAMDIPKFFANLSAAVFLAPAYVSFWLCIGIQALKNRSELKFQIPFKLPSNTFD